MSAADPYLSSLEEQDRAVDQELADLDVRRKEAELKRQRIQAAREHYLAFLQSNTPPRLELTASPARSAATPRIGEKRRAILEAYAKYTAMGRTVTLKTVEAETGFDHALVYNVTWDDTKRKNLRKEGDQYTVTEQGFEFLKAAGSQFGAFRVVNAKTPVNPLD